MKVEIYRSRNYWRVSNAAKMLLDYLSERVDEYTLDRLTDCFVGITDDVQLKMVKFFLDEYFHYSFPAFANPKYTGIQHVDKMLIDMLNWIEDYKRQEELEHGY